jgi:hypothetical protein
MNDSKIPKLVVHALTAALACSLALSACGDDGEARAAGAARAAALGPHGIDAVLGEWKSAGLTVSAFDGVDGDKYGGGDCQAGTVNGVDATVCVHPDDAAAKAAVDAARASVGLTDGLAAAHGRLVLVMADRRKADPQGRTINQASKLFAR